MPGDGPVRHREKPQSMHHAPSSLDSPEGFEQAVRDRGAAGSGARKSGNPVHRKQWRGLQGRWRPVIHNMCAWFQVFNQVF
jgi:hypothetical protein